jgi:hypothetical protein
VRTKNLNVTSAANVSVIKTVADTLRTENIYANRAGFNFESEDEQVDMINELFIFYWPLAERIRRIIQREAKRMLERKSQKLYKPKART